MTTTDTKTPVTNTKQYGPNVQRLIARKMALDAPSGFEGALNFLSSKENITEGAKKASAWVQAACQALREAGEPNPFKESTDEQIAEHLLQQIMERERKEPTK